MSKKKYALIIQARLKSTRFPNKILRKVNKKEVLTIMLKRLNKKFRNKIIVAVGNTNCEKIINICKKQKTKFFIVKH